MDIFKKLYMLRPRINEKINNTIKIKNRTLAILAAPAAIPLNPNTPAINAKTINEIVQRNIINCF